MCAHGFDRLVSDDTFLKQLTNTFLIRDPAKAIASYYAMNRDVTVEEIGLKQLCAIYEKTKALGSAPIVVDADDLEDNPEGTVRAYCEALGIAFIPESMTWDSGEKNEWEIWKDWHKDAARSTGIQKNMEVFETTVENSDHLRRFYEDQLPFYEIMYADRIQPKPADTGI
jgi:hypothetical protein